MAASIGAFTDLNVDNTSPTITYQIDNILHHHQAPIDIINTTLSSHEAILASHQSDIADIKTILANNTTSINRIIHSLSILAMKLDIQITLPQPLPLSPAPPTPLSSTVLNSATAPSSTTSPAPSLASVEIKSTLRQLSKTQNPTSLDYGQVANNLIDTPLPSTAATHHLCLNSFSNAMCFKNNIATIRSSFIHRSLPLLFPTLATNNSNIITEANPASDFDFTSPPLSFIFSTHSALLADAEHFVTDLMNNIFIPGKKKLQETILTAVHNFSFDSNSVTVCITNKGPCESKIYIFDPGGICKIENISDLEDKVIFEGMAMIRSAP